jgi:hypothetical protein
MNAGKAPLSLDNVRFTDGVSFAFVLGTTLPPGGRTLAIESSPALLAWTIGSFTIVSEIPRPDGSLTVTARSLTPATGSLYA